MMILISIPKWSDFNDGIIEENIEMMINFNPKMV